MRLAFVLAALTLGGCQLYFGGDDEPPPCNGGGYVDGYPSNLLRDPQTGDCQEFGYGGGGGGGCGWEGDEPTQDVAIPNWPQCESSCSILDEETCIEQPGCQVAYWEEAKLADAPSTTSFRGCYATLSFGAEQSSCWNLDAYGCVQNDGCSIFYATAYDAGGGPKPLTPPAPSPTFSRCAPEASQNGCSTVDCGVGYHCEDACYPTDCGKGDLTDCEGTGTQCTPMCVPDQGTGCANVDCGPDYQCVETCETQDPSTMGGAFPGQCYGTCVPTTACEALTTEGTCNARGDCTSVYDGDDCTCYPGGYCECAILTWDHCESYGGAPLPL